MRRYAAPMEGITGYVYRNAHHRVFGGVDRYFTPFLSPGKKRGLRSRELNDVLPEHNEGVPVVPQILTNDWEDFLHTAEILREFGYEEVNLNLGCPSGTVAAKKRGAGFLGYPEELDLFLGRIFDGTDMGISVKTRIGVERPEEFERLLAIYRKYPLRELIVHPRVLRDGYANTPDLPAFLQALEDSPLSRLLQRGSVQQGGGPGIFQVLPPGGEGHVRPGAHRGCGAGGGAGRRGAGREGSGDDGGALSGISRGDSPGLLPDHVRGSERAVQDEGALVLHASPLPGQRILREEDPEGGHGGGVQPVGGEAPERAGDSAAGPRNCPSIFFQNRIK